jgi:large subunit ribosomal protein L35
MPKLKTKSGAKKRFRFTATGKVKFQPSHKRHMLRRRSQKMKRKARGMQVLNPSDTTLVMKYMPYDR